MDADRLKSISLFAPLTDDDRESIAALASELSVPNGKILVKEGDYAYELMAIEEGNARVERGGEQVAELGPGDFFGEIGVLESELRTATVLAASPMRLVVLSHWEIKRMEKRSPQAMDRLYQAIEERRPPAAGEAG